MKKESNKRLYFTDDFSPENVAKLQGEGYILRKASAYHEADTLEPCSEVAGDVPKAYLDLIKRNNSNIVTIEAKVGITPELQQTIDDAKAECEKVIAENEVLKKQVEAYQQTELRNSELLSENSRLSDALVKLNGVLVERNALAGQVKDLEAKLKKQTATEVKAAKTAEAKE
ncbi:hypothetical protein [Acinetobacter sp. YH12140]|uniref:hypothetical protein n=1 Tax=Acinetobacter sp. YH12140 TaxID=2601124 RepID=UPI0015D3EB22|nr:hypothetical protein [Acinetobacter sp. YH12140]